MQPSSVTLPYLHRVWFAFINVWHCQKMDEMCCMVFMLQIPLSPWPKTQPALSPIPRIWHVWNTKLCWIGPKTVIKPLPAKPQNGFPPMARSLWTQYHQHSMQTCIDSRCFHKDDKLPGPTVWGWEWHGRTKVWVPCLDDRAVIRRNIFCKCECGCTNNDTDKWLSQKLQNLIGVIMQHNNRIVIIGMTQYISIQFFNIYYQDQHKIAGYKSMWRCGRFCYKKMMWVQFFKMYISNIYVHIYVCMYVCVPYHSKKVKDSIKNTLQIVVVSILNFIDCVHQIVHKILMFFQNISINSNLTTKMDFSYLKTWKSGITLDSTCKSSRYVRLSCSGGGHIGLFEIRPPGGHLKLFTMVFGNLIPILVTIPNFKNLSPSARFYELVPRQRLISTHRTHQHIHT